MTELSAAEWVTEKCVDGGIACSFEIVKKLHEEQSDFQKIEVFETKKFGNVMAIDGFFQLTSRDNFLYHEMMTHPALFTHPHPKNVAIIGGGDCGSLREVLKHPEVEKAWQIDIDERVTRLSEHYFPELCASNDDSRAELIFGDGIRWIKDAQESSLDIIIIDSTDPIGPAEGLFGRPFYEDCLKALSPGGILIQQSESPLLHKDSIILPMHQQMKLAGFTKAKTLYYPQPCYPSGQWTATMTTDTASIERPDLSRVSNRTFKTVYYNEAIHQGALADPQFMVEALAVLNYE